MTLRPSLKKCKDPYPQPDSEESIEDCLTPRLDWIPWFEKNFIIVTLWIKIVKIRSNV